SFVFAGNRAIGYPFEVRSHDSASNYRTDLAIHQTDGNIISQPTADRTSTGSVNLRIGATNGYFVRVESSKKSKYLIEDIKTDPYKLLNVNPRDWFDKNNTESFADALS